MPGQRRADHQCAGQRFASLPRPVEASGFVTSQAIASHAAAAPKPPTASDGEREPREIGEIPTRTAPRTATPAAAAPARRPCASPITTATPTNTTKEFMAWPLGKL